MNIEDESPKSLIFRFKWVDKDTIIIASKDGLEKKVDLCNPKFELAYNVIPIFTVKKEVDL